MRSAQSPFIRQPVKDIINQSGTGTNRNDDGSGPTLRKSISTFELAMMGVGCTVGTGIFYVFSIAVPEAGPAVILAFLVAAATAGLTALCYAELASSIPTSGSSYTYTYATLGELVGYLVGWCLLLEYAVSGAAVAVGWSEYLNDFLQRVFGWHLPDYLSVAPWDGGSFHSFSINLPAVVLVTICCFLLMAGTRESARANAVMVLLKLGVLLMFSVVAFTGFQSGNYHPFAPMGVAGVGAAAGSVFFSFIGLDVISTASEEVKDPHRTIPRALVIALVVVTGIYMLVAVAAVGAQEQSLFQHQKAGLSQILEHVSGSGTFSIILSAAAVISIFSITLVTIFGQTRVLFAMSRDGMIPKGFAYISPRTRTPVINTAITCLVVGLLAGFLPLDYLSDMVSIGTLTAFAVVSLGVIILRRRNPTMQRGFRVPLYPATPIISIIACLYLISQLHPITWATLAVWMLIACLTYVGYGYRHSSLRMRLLAAEAAGVEVDVNGSSAIPAESASAQSGPAAQSVPAAQSSQPSEPAGLQADTSLPTNDRVE
ncbi:amino acid permease [Lawsonella clevelandensis]|uniref:amino acid permease n=1 Tax=Lawsonella clevelandensis TaxID=1528099 RepID=UPI0023F17CCD|nr:amino acid permease [Lawsonella clevelandensis]